MSRVDVVIPCYCYGRFLRSCVGSIVSQEGVDVRVLIIDDCSPDDSAQVAAAIAAEDSRVTVRRHEKNRGHIATYNEGLLEWVSAEYCVLISADDFLVPGSLKRAVDLMNAHRDVSFVYGGVLRWSGDGVMPAPRGVDAAEPARVENGEAWITRICKMGYNPVISPEVVVRTRVHHDVGGYQPELPYTGDLELWLRLATRGDVGYLNADQAVYRVHKANMHKSLLLTKFDEIKYYWVAFDEHFRKWNHLPNKAELVKCVGGNLAKQALDAGNKAFYAKELQLAASLRTLAIEMLPEARNRRDCRMLGWKLRLGPKLWRALWWLAFPMWLPGNIKRGRAESKKKRVRARQVSVA